MRIGLILFSVLLAAAASATTYKWVDKQGVTHYSDRPEPGAQVVELQQAQTFEAPATATPRQSPRNRQASEAVQYQLEVWKPENDETIVNTGNTVSLRLRLEPELQDGHSIWVYLDGKRVDGLPGNGESFELTDVARGTHTLSVVVSDFGGKPVISSPSITFHVRQPSLLAPNRVPRPTPR